MTTIPSLRAARPVALAIAALILLAGRGLAQQPATPAAGTVKPPTIAVIDMGKVSSDSLLGKSYAALLNKLHDDLEAERTKKQDGLDKLDAAIKALQDELDSQAQVLSADALEKKREELTKKARDRQAFVEDGQREIQRKQERAQARAQSYNSEFEEKIRPSIEAVVKELGIDILLDSQVTLAHNTAYDISQQVIAKADAAQGAKGN